MIHTLSPLTRMASVPMRAALDEPAPPAPPAPPAQPDSIDFSKIDCPLKAALLPATEPAVQLGVIAGIMFAVMSGAQSGAVPLVSVEVASKTGSQLMNLSYDIDLKNNESPLSGSGTVAGQDASVSLGIDQASRSASLRESIGGSSATLAIAFDEQQQQLKAKGKVGDVDVALAFSPIVGSGGKDDYKGFHVEGTLGGEAYSVDNNFEVQKAMDGQQGTMTTRGKLGEHDISKDYTMSAAQNPGGIALTISGKGTTAGIAQEVNVKMTLVG